MADLPARILQIGEKFVETPFEDFLDPVVHQALMQLSGETFSLIGVIARSAAADGSKRTLDCRHAKPDRAGVLRVQNQ